MRDIENLSAKDVCDCCAAGDALAQKCIDRAADALGTALACIGCIVNPEAFLFGGGMAAAGDILLEPIGRVYNAKVFPAAARHADFTGNAGQRGRHYRRSASGTD